MYQSPQTLPYLTTGLAHLFHTYCHASKVYIKHFLNKIRQKQKKQFSTQPPHPAYLDKTPVYVIHCPAL